MTYLRWMTFAFLLIVSLMTLAFASVPEGDAAVDTGDYVTAISAYEAAYAADANDVEALYKLARAKVYQAGTLEGDEAEALYEEAVNLAREAVTLAPDDAETHFEVARAVGRLAQFRGVLDAINLAAEVKDALERTIELNPEHGGAYHALALWNLEVPWIAGGRTGEVKPLFDQALAVEPDVITHYVDYGEALIRLDEPEAARGMLEQALTLTPSTVREEADFAKGQELLAGL